MNPTIQSLLAVQADDLRIFELEDRLTGLQPRLDALERERRAVADRVERANAAIAAEEAKLRQLRERVDKDKALVERAQRQYEAATNPREAAAATTQLEQTQRMMRDTEREAAAIQARIAELRAEAEAQQAGLADVEARQQEARGAIDAERTQIEGELGAARGERADRANAVPRKVLGMYDRVASRRRATTVYPLHGVSCGACDTALPTQRRSQMATTGSVEVCEGCGALLYASE